MLAFFFFLLVSLNQSVSIRLHESYRSLTVLRCTDLTHSYSGDRDERSSPPTPRTVTGARAGREGAGICSLRAEVASSEHELVNQERASERGAVISVQVLRKHAWNKLQKRYLDIIVNKSNRIE